MLSKVESGESLIIEKGSWTPGGVEPTPNPMPPGGFESQMKVNLEPTLDTLNQGLGCGMHNML